MPNLRLYSTNIKLIAALWLSKPILSQSLEPKLNWLYLFLILSPSTEGKQFVLDLYLQMAKPAYCVWVFTLRISHFIYEESWNLNNQLVNFSQNLL